MRVTMALFYPDVTSTNRPRRAPSSPSRPRLSPRASSRRRIRLGLALVPKHRLYEELASLVRAPHQRPAGDVSEPHHLLAVPLPVVELLRGDVLHDVEVGGRGAKVLAQREDVHPGVLAVPHRLGDLLVALAQSEHDASFGDQTLGSRRLGVPQDAEGLIVPGSRVPHAFLQPLHRLDVVSENVQTRVGEVRHRALVALKVRREALGEDLGLERLEGPDGPREVLGSAVGDVVAVHRRQHDVADAPLRDGLGGVLGLHLVGGRGRGRGVHRAEAASARARVAEDHDRRGSRVAVPALAQVGAHGLLAHGGELEILEPGGEVLVAIAARRALAQPRGFGQTRGFARNVAFRGVRAGDGGHDHGSAHGCRRVHRRGYVHAALLRQLDEPLERVAGLLERAELLALGLRERDAVLARGGGTMPARGDLRNPRDAFRVRG
mmetsp:Transcript_5130/g.22907  ORF Transcript_5130/g.22907 Transcript_5130/m.22907 type:complete len:436 (-) Transcript_5130:137-1444(-)